MLDEDVGIAGFDSFTVISYKSAMYILSYRKSNPELIRLSRTPTLTGCLYQPATGLDSIRPKVPRL